MAQFKWSILDISVENEQITNVKYFVKAQDEKNTVESEGNHTFKEGTVCKPFAEIKEEDLIRWLEQDTTQDEINIIKSNLEKQLEALKTSKKAEFPWLADTFTVE